MPSAAPACFPQVAGLRVTYHCDGTTPAIDGIWKTPEGQPEVPVGPTDTVRLVTNDFKYNGGGDGYTALAGGTDVLTPGDGLLEISIEWVTANSPVDPQIAGRVTRSP